MGVDHDAVRVSVDHLQPQLVLGQVDGPLQAFASLRRHQRRDRLRVEPAGNVSSLCFPAHTPASVDRYCLARGDGGEGKKVTV